MDEPKNDISPPAYWLLITILMGVLFVFGVLFMHMANAKSVNWDNVGHDAATRLWFQQLKQPDTLTMGGNGTSCCGEADAYYAETHIEDGKTYAIINDERDDGPLQRAHVPNGTRYLVPDQKIVDVTKQGGNPVGRTIIFLGFVIWQGNEAHPEQRGVLCFIPSEGY